MNTKIVKVDNKIPNVTYLVKKSDYDAKILDIEKKYFTTADYNKFTSETLDAKRKKKELVNKFDISNLVKNSDLNTKLATLATKAGLKAEQDKTVKLQTHELSYFLGKNFFGDDGSPNTFVYQPKRDKLELKKTKALIMFFVGNQGIFTSKLKPIYTAFLHSKKFSGYKVGVKFDKVPSAVEQNNYVTKIVNTYIVYELNAWQKNPTSNFKF